MRRYRVLVREPGRRYYAVQRGNEEFRVVVGARRSLDQLVPQLEVHVGFAAGQGVSTEEFGAQGTIGDLQGVQKVPGRPPISMRSTSHRGPNLE
jgi:hypothetical protein